MQENNKLNISPQFDFAKTISLEGIKNEVKQLIEQKPINIGSVDNKSLFILKPANSWLADAKMRPVAKMLFSEFWYENELCILFSDTNMGKSILAVQIGNSISKGLPLHGFKLEAEKQPVLYFDFELSDKQFERRYSIASEHVYEFDNSFIRVEIDPNAIFPANSSFEDFLNKSLEQAIIDTEAKVLIIDNITYLKNETEKAKDALPLMKHLKELKRKYDLSILCLAHTPKRDSTKPISRNDLQGSKMLINFSDSAFAIGESQSDKHIRYLKQIKQRNVEQVYDSENVILCQINKPNNFLQFEHSGFGSERKHLATPTENSSEERIQKIMELNKQGLSSREIGKQLQISHMTVQRTINKICNNM